MNPTKIEWTDKTWNPIVGCSKRCHDEQGKIWCYAYWQAKRQKHNCQLCYEFIPHLHPERLEEPYKIKKPQKIFVCSMGEFFDRKVKESWREKIYSVIEKNPQHTFQILTKQPQNIPKRTYPKNLWIGMSLNGKYDDISEEDIIQFKQIFINKIHIRFLSLEPYLEQIPAHIIDHFDWIIVGGLTGYKKQPPQKEWIEQIIKRCNEKDIPLFLKDNCQYQDTIREYPKEEQE
jgi:protein gp37